MPETFRDVTYLLRLTWKRWKRPDRQVRHCLITPYLEKKLLQMLWAYWANGRP